ncbi:MAG: hypothetical protein LQ338_001513 [Usnochroma carphineum]|nr:MAG: hypothetical protein LQ338_001513 [Usnochroma carphineum]
MADDGMLVNFSIEGEVRNIKPVFRGGRWKERLAAKRAAQRGSRPKSQNPEPSTVGDVTTANAENQGDAISESPAKRQKTNDFSNNLNKFHPPTTSKAVVSSIFSYNPSSTSKLTNPPPQDDSLPTPSNAPLPSEISNFTSLGLSPTISTHLLSKLSLKAPTAIQKSTITQLLKEDSDGFIQAETGSGKTLAYLLPVVQRMMSLSLTTKDGEENRANKKRINRDSGLFAIVLAPTRELCKQISVVLENLLRCVNWIVAGTVIGGEKKKSEKARLRKGLNILVATPGRLVDHLDNTEVLDVSQVRWLVLDEGDRLVELGFEDDVRKIVQELEKKSESAHRDGKEKVVENLPPRRTTVLCSATMKMNVQRLGEISLKDAVHIKADPTSDDELIKDHQQEKNETTFLAPAQLKQSYVVVPPKQRLVTLAAFLKRTFLRKGSVMKAIVFLSCADSVDFHFEVFARKPMTTTTNSQKAIQNTSHEPTEKDPNQSESDIENINTSSQPLFTTTRASPILSSTSNPNLHIHKLHGSLPQTLRTATLSAFTRSPHPSILLCTDVASRGLDLPSIDLIISYDPPFSRDDHLHRIGRTARAGREGRAVIFLMPGPEEGYVGILRQGYRDGVGRGLIRHEAEEILKKGFGNAEASMAVDQTPSVQGGDKWNERAEQWQLEAERWVIDDERGKAGEMAKRAFVSHVRAYATHVATERAMFDVKGLHLGHLAKAFALRERPGQFGRGERKAAGKRGGKRAEREERESASAKTGEKGRKREVEVEDVGGRDVARKMRSKMKEHLAGASEFNIG